MHHNEIAILPRPVSVERADGYFTLNSATTIAASHPATPCVQMLRDRLHASTGYEFPESTIPATKNAIRLILDSPSSSTVAEGYTLSVTGDGVTITASDASGLFYGTQSLLQLLPPEIFGTSKADRSWAIPYVTITDYPRFRWRGLMLDCARHFMPISFIHRFIDVMAMHKFNTLHWHLTDDQGWRLQINKYPRLTEVGAWRPQTLIGHLDTAIPHEYDGVPHGGFYTQDEVRQLVRYAADRAIKIVPEVEMPGHARAAIAAYPQLGNDPTKQLDVWCRWGIDPNIFNADESTIRFLQNVLDEVIDLFPSRFIHVGGDEAPKEQWKTSLAAQRRISELGLKDEEELQGYYTRRMDEFLHARGRRLIGWDEILAGGLSPHATVMSWRGESGGVMAARAGHDVVMTPHEFTYFDKYQTSDHASESLSQPYTLMLQSVYEYNPVPPDLNFSEATHILGAQGQLWTEYMPTPKHVERRAFPRACALAEVIWTPLGKKNYSDFVDRLRTSLLRLEQVGVTYWRDF